jgi:hypothetical protein
MHGRFAALCVRFAAFLALALAPQALPAETPPEQWLIVSDVHFDPFASPKLVDRLAASPPDQWRAIFESVEAPVSVPGADTNYALLKRTLIGMREATGEGPKAILYGGDFLAHEFRKKFDASATRHDDASYEAFVDKTIAFLSDEFRAAFPRALLYPALGNNDSYCGDYHGAPNSPFLQHLAASWAWGFGTNAATIQQQFATDGYYAVDLPVARTRLVVVNSVPWSAGYQNACGDPKSDPGGDELAWLQKTLAATPPGEQVWVLSHMPPGVDVYSTLHSNVGGTAGVVMMLGDRFNQPFLTAIANPSSRVTFALAGHTHTFGFRILASDQSPHAVVPMLVAPSVSPIFGSNPSFMVADVDPLSAVVSDYRVEIFDDAHWRREFDFDRAFGTNAVNADSLEALQSAIFDVGDIRKRYDSFNDGGSGRSPITDATWRAYWCGATTFAPPAFVACVRPQIDTDKPQQPTPPPPPPAPTPTPAPTLTPTPTPTLPPLEPR